MGETTGLREGPLRGHGYVRKGVAISCERPELLDAARKTSKILRDLWWVPGSAQPEPLFAVQDEELQRIGLQTVQRTLLLNLSILLFATLVSISILLVGTIRNLSAYVQAAQALLPLLFVFGLYLISRRNPADFTSATADFVRLRTALRPKPFVFTVAIVAIAALGYFARSDLYSVVEPIGFQKDLVRAGEWWRMIVGPFVHLNAGHLLINCGLILLFGTLIEKGNGTARFSIIFVLSMLGGAIGSMIISPLNSAGLSGAGEGLIGATAMWALRSRSWTGRMQGVYFLAAAALAHLAQELRADQTDVGGHVFGYLGGFLSMAVIQFCASRPQLTPLLRVVGITATTLLVSSSVIFLGVSIGTRA